MGRAADWYEAVVTERLDPWLWGLDYSENRRARPCHESCRETRADALTAIGVARRLGRCGSVMLVIGRDLGLSRTCMQPLNSRPGNSRGQEYHGKCDGSALAQPR